MATKRNVPLDIIGDIEAVFASGDTTKSTFMYVIKCNGKDHITEYHRISKFARDSEENMKAVENYVWNVVDDKLLGAVKHSAERYLEELRKFYNDDHDDPIKIIDAFQKVQRDYYELATSDKIAFTKSYPDVYGRIQFALEDME